jgi:hypothetical protein
MNLDPQGRTQRLQEQNNICDRDRQPKKRMREGFSWTVCVSSRFGNREQTFPVSDSDNAVSAILEATNLQSQWSSCKTWLLFWIRIASVAFGSSSSLCLEILSEFHKRENSGDETEPDHEQVTDFQIIPTYSASCVDTHLVCFSIFYCLLFL